MTFDEVYETLPGNGWLSREEAELLWRWANSLMTMGYVNILEVGCYEGRSTCLLAKVPKARVRCVDPFDGFAGGRTGDEVERAWKDNVQSRGLTNVALTRSRVEDFNVAWKRFDLAYLDGDHTPEGTRVQIDKALATEADIVAIHDVNDSGDGLLIKQVALEMLGPWTERVGRLAVWDRR